MVITFLVVSDFRESAKYLSRTHLGKQRVEAMQIRNALFDLVWISDYFELKIPPRGANREQIYEWVQEVKDLIKQIPYRLIARLSGDVDAVAFDKEIFRLKNNEKYTIDGNKVVVNKGKSNKISYSVDKEQFLFAGDHEIGVGLRKHPVLYLWHTYITALEFYTNVHIDEWEFRGYKNTMARYNVGTNYDIPPWVFNPEFHRTMKARLREKEITWISEYEDGNRKQIEIKYTKNSFFLEAGEDTGYLW